MPPSHPLLVGEADASTCPEILVVDDEPLVRKMLEDSLGHFGFRVHAAASAAEAIALFEEQQASIAMVLLDVQMPGLDGPQTVAGLRRIAPHVRFCFMSGNTGRSSHSQLLDMGAAAVFPKPFPIADLAHHLRQLIVPD